MAKGKMILFGALGLVLLGGGGAGAWFSGLVPGFGPAAADGEADHEAAPAPAPSYVAMNDVVAPIVRGDRLSHYLMLALSIEVPAATGDHAPGSTEAAVKADLVRLQAAFVRDLSTTPISLDQEHDLRAVGPRLTAIAQAMLGADKVSAVLITAAAPFHG